MILTEQNIREKTISELLYHSVYPETIEMNMNSKEICEYIEFIRLYSLYTYNRSLVNEFINHEQGIIQTKGPNIDNYIFDKNLSLENIIGITKSEQERLHQKHDEYYSFTYGESITLLIIYEKLYKIFKRLSKKVPYSLERELYKYSLSDFSKHRIDREGLSFKGIDLTSDTDSYYYRWYYLEQYKIIRNEIYKRFGVSFSDRFDILERDIRKYFRVRNVINEHKSSIEKGEEVFIQELEQLKQNVSDKKLIKKL